VRIELGIYFHWGVYSVPAYANEWYPRSMYGKNSNERKHHTEVYGAPEEWPYSNFITGAKDKQGNFIQFAPKLKSEGGNFDPDEWAQLLPTPVPNFPARSRTPRWLFDVGQQGKPLERQRYGPKLDLVGLLTDAIRKGHESYLINASCI
jgi:alpha-L-fucosidase